MSDLLIGQIGNNPCGKTENIIQRPALYLHVSYELFCSLCAGVYVCRTTEKNLKRFGGPNEPRAQRFYLRSQMKVHLNCTSVPSLQNRNPNRPLNMAHTNQE